MLKSSTQNLGDITEFICARDQPWKILHDAFIISFQNFMKSFPMHFLDAILSFLLLNENHPSNFRLASHGIRQSLGPEIVQKSSC